MLLGSLVKRAAEAVILLLLVAACTPLPARERWISISTSHFEMYTDNSEKRAIEALQTFEQVRYFFLKTSARQQPPEGRVRIIAFSSEKEFKPYRPNAGTFAYYQPSPQRDYIVMQDIEPAHSRVAVHEYTHLVVQHLKLELPTWLNEGMADLYSSLEPQGTKALVGRPLPEHAATLISRPWMDWEVLFRVDHKSPYYNEPDKMQIFYAQSWALTHMLELSAPYSARFTKFLAIVASGVSTTDALQRVYGKSVSDIGRDVRNYVHQTTVKGAVFDVTLSKSDLNPQITELSEFDLELALADFLSTRLDTASEARKRLLTLEKQNPKNRDVELSMGYLAWEEKNLDEARQHFSVAINEGVKDPKVIYQYAQLLRNSSAPAAQIEALLQEVLTLQPDNLEACLFLSGTALNAGHFGVALAALSTVRNVPPENAYDFFSMNAFARSQLKDYAHAKENATRALAYAKNPDQRLQITNILDFINRATEPKAEPGPTSDGDRAVPTLAQKEIAPASKVGLELHPDLPRVQGETKSFECLPGGIYHLHLQVGNREMVFAVPRDPRDVFVRNTENPTALFTCGPLKSQVLSVVYTPATTQDKIDGIMAELIY